MRPSACTASWTDGSRRSPTWPADYSIADIATFPWVARWPWHGLDNGLKDYPNVVRWYDAIRARPAVQRGYNVPASDQEIPAP